MYLIKESFQAGSAVHLIDKISKVLSRRLGKLVTITTVNITYSNSLGKFQGFYGIAGSTVFRLNFLLASSDEIFSVDLFDSDLSYPKVTVELQGMNIIQVIESLTEELSGESIDESVAKIVEYTKDDRKTMLFNTWLEEEKDSLELLQNKKLSIVYVQFIKKDKYNKEINLPSFTSLAKQYLFGLGLTNPSFRVRRRGSPDREIVDKAKQDQIQDIVDTMSWEKKFKFLEASVKAVVDNKIQSLICYGSPGSGKTETIMNNLRDLGVKPKVFSGGFKNADEVFSLLTKYNKGTILVFDDCDSVMKNVELRNMFKAALQNSANREITWRDKVLSFDSGVIFISNLTKFDPAIASRSMTIEINMSNEQMIDKIESVLKNFMPEVDMKIKHMALDFAKEISTGVKAVDFREVQKIIIAIELQPHDWKDFAMLMLSSQ